MRIFSSAAFFLVVFCATVITLGCLSYNYGIGAVSDKTENVEFSIESGSTYLSIAPLLKEKNLIRSEVFYKIYVKIFEPTNLQAGTYLLNESMGVKQIIEALEKGNSGNPDAINVTFKEGLNMRGVAKVISEKTNNTYESVFELLKDSNYIDRLINNYWFLTADIKNKDIYYPLEGYLFPNTYNIDKDDSVEDIFKIMLDETKKQLEPFRTKIESSKYTIHELITLASIIELEAGNANDRNGVAGVFFNRLDGGWTLGSDVTTYYAEKKELWVEDLTTAEIEDCNAYNTRGTCFSGLPVGPIANPGIESISAVFNPTSHNYYYFVADKNGKTYFNVNSTGHYNTIAKLKSEGLWFEYQN
ncbi:MAG: endolytic transglycosylase MltG [Ignavibacteriales bacterium]